jgi:RNA polymerase sigma-70 factor, ECF subfamily
MMRRVLVDSARNRKAIKRGGGTEAMALDRVEIATSAPENDLVALEEALQRLEALNARAGKVVEMRFFGGFSVEETAATLAISKRTVINDWNTARAWLHNEIVRAHSGHQR